MPTLNIKHRMIATARKIASIEFQDKIEKMQYEVNSIPMDVIITANQQREIEVNRILNKHPEFDSDVFRSMVKRFMQDNREKEREFLV
jgi:hypothetical protein